jgi:hypothetical protein
MPTPKKLTNASAEITLGMPSVTTTSTGPRELGTMWGPRSFAGVTPQATAAGMKSWPSIASTCARARRARCTQPTAPSASTMCQYPGPRMAATTDKNKKSGNTYIASVKRMSTLSACWLITLSSTSPDRSTPICATPTSGPSPATCSTNPGESASAQPPSPSNCEPPTPPESPGPS